MTGPGTAAERTRSVAWLSRELPRFAPGGVDGMRVLHLQAGTGGDSLELARRGATVVGIDLDPVAVATARSRAASEGVTGARFVRGDLYDARHLLPEPESFDLVYTTWGTIGGLDDLAEWARIIGWFLRANGTLYFADRHPLAAGVVTAGASVGSGAGEPRHPLASVLAALADAGLTVISITDHADAPYRLLPALVESPEGFFGWPGEQWVPLGLSIIARRA